MSFDGFGDETFAFLRDLKANNAKEWFQQKDNQSRYRAHLVAPAKAFVVAIGEELSDLGDLNAVPSGNGSLGRINRDIRFSKDKAPYNTHLSFDFWLGEGTKKESAGFRVWVGLDGLSVGAGSRGLSDLDAFRAAIDEPGRGDALAAALTDAESQGFVRGGDAYKRVPKPYPADHPHAELLKLKSFHVVERTAFPKSVSLPSFVPHVAGRMRACLPVARWLQGLLG